MADRPGSQGYTDQASNGTNALSARMLIVEYYCTAIPGPDTNGMSMSKSIRVPTNSATARGGGLGEY